MPKDAPTAAELLTNPDALLSTSHLRQLGLGRRAIDAVLRGVPTIHLPGYSRPLIRVRDYRALVDAHTYNGEQVRPANEPSGPDERYAGIDAPPVSAASVVSTSAPASGSPSGAGRPVRARRGHRLRHQSAPARPCKRDPPASWTSSAFADT
jgi:hypothetical protein